MKCNKVKNPCKICFESVNKKTGLQCQGACQKWAHFKCLNYTPGKIQDIKAGIIKITCPCPDCDTSQPKEVLTDPPYTCTNTQCPATKLPVCESTECPSRGSPISLIPRSVQYSPALAPAKREHVSCPAKRPLKSNQRDISTSSSGVMPKKQTCMPQCMSSNQQSKKNAKMSCSPKQSQSCSNFSNSSGKQCLEQARTVSSDTHISSVDQKILITALENLCNTVGQLTIQLRDFMCKMKEVVV